MKILPFYFLLLFIVGAVFALPHNANAARFIMQSQTAKLDINDSIDLIVYISTEGESINAIEGNLNIPQSFSIEKISIGNSLVSPWLEAPHQSGDEIIFSGIIPGGIKSDNVQLFTVSLIAKNESAVSLQVSGNAYLNDGVGTIRTTEPLTAEFFISNNLGGKVYSADFTKDNEPPEPFIPQVSKNENIFEGDYFISFETQDKSSGVSTYKIAEIKSFFTPKPKEEDFKVTQSPARLLDQNLSSYIFVKAIDGNNNERTALILPKKGLGVYKEQLLFGILIVCIALIYLISGRFKRKNEF